MALAETPKKEEPKKEEAKKEEKKSSGGGMFGGLTNKLSGKQKESTQASASAGGRAVDPTRPDRYAAGGGNPNKVAVSISPLFVSSRSNCSSLWKVIPARASAVSILIGGSWSIRNPSITASR